MDGVIDTYGHLSDSNNPQLSIDCTKWIDGALSDFNGEANSEILKKYGNSMGTSIYDYYPPMHILLKKFNSIDYTGNQGYTDWYIPALGQLALMYLNMTAINEALTAIGGTTFSDDSYWSSSEYDGLDAWAINMLNSRVYNGGKDSGCCVRFIRNIP